MKKFSLLIFFVIGVGIFAFTQTPEKLIIKHEVGLFLGNSEDIYDSLPNGQNLDFMNYLQHSYDWVDYSYVGISTSLWFKGGWEVKARIAVDDSFNPNFMDFNVSYLPFQTWGFTAGIFRRSKTIENYNLFHLQTDIGYYGDLNSNFRQIRIHDRGFQFGVLTRTLVNHFEFEGEIVGGMTATAPFRVFIHQKLMGGNLLRTYKYQTKGTPSLFVSPTLSVTYNHENSKKKIFGVGLVLKWFIVSKAIDYKRTEMLWTNDNITSKSISSDKHWLNQFDLRLAIHWQW